MGATCILRRRLPTAAYEEMLPQIDFRQSINIHKTQEGIEL
jgi:hypothetical protein